MEAVVFGLEACQPRWVSDVPPVIRPPFELQTVSLRARYLTRGMTRAGPWSFERAAPGTGDSDGDRTGDGASVQSPQLTGRAGHLPLEARSPVCAQDGEFGAAIPWMYLKDVSTGEMQAALEVLLGPEAKGLL